MNLWGSQDPASPRARDGVHAALAASHAEPCWGRLCASCVPAASWKPCFGPGTARGEQHRNNVQDFIACKVILLRVSHTGIQWHIYGLMLKLYTGRFRAPGCGSVLSGKKCFQKKRKPEFTFAEIAFHMSAAVCFKGSAPGVLWWCISVPDHLNKTILFRGWGWKWKICRNGILKRVELMGKQHVFLIPCFCSHYNYLAWHH